MLNLCAILCNLRVSVDNLLLHPTLNKCTTVRCVYKTYWHAECLLKLLTKAVTYCRELSKVLRVANSPLSILTLLNRDVALWSLLSDTTGAEQTDVGIHLTLKVLLHIKGLANWPLHITLTRAEPYLTKEDVAQSANLLASLDSHAMRVETCCRNSYRCNPYTLGISLNNDWLAGNPVTSDRYLSFWLCISPDIYSAILLQHHIISDSRWNF